MVTAGILGISHHISLMSINLCDERSPNIVVGLEDYNSSTKFNIYTSNIIYSDRTVTSLC